MGIIEFNKIYSELVCENAPITDEHDKTVDPWEGVKPHVKGGFYEEYCQDKQLR